MPFFIPRRLIDFEYFESGEVDEEYTKLAKDYKNDIDFAFFAVNFNYSKSDYEELTPKEKTFIYKAWEDKIVRESTLLNNAVYNAIANSHRKKGKKYQKLWKKKPKSVDQDIAYNNMKIIKDIEKRDGKSWIEKIYKAGGLNASSKKRGD
ncbi:hypothetical protein [Garciella nitratireducens]|uniref:Uncharacterized protein n=1 Tax=Garciella nitratireducens DSM 15102 TaxID=1121911 RepID=A0A1T4K664_9FIRM|nr:hypothetical protein [Garciella nitratireducens]SJZ37901.1 hypothetical protein SAMN02745973_00366 [Garciella nitratireducens DSM 15102]